MIFTKHSNLIDQHAFLSPSKHYWIHYDPDKLSKTYINHMAVELGVKYHKIASELVQMGIRLLTEKTAIGQYVNDCIEDGMTTEQPLYYSDNCFGTADAISFENNYLKIYDLKTGSSPVSIEQLRIYAALFCLEYSYNPHSIKIELRIYQKDKPVLIEMSDPDVICNIMDQIEVCDEIINNIKQSGEMYYE